MVGRDGGRVGGGVMGNGDAVAGVMHAEEETGGALWSWHRVVIVW